ncbi:MAG: penicillin-insensitive murein endopeptidase [Sandaracinaceae bacterium]
MFAFGTLLVVAFVQPHAVAQDEPSESVSEGTPQRGHLTNAAELPLRGHGFHWETQRRNADGRYGTEELVHALVHAAGVVADAHPGSDLLIEDLSRPSGGRIRGHRSHRSGRDADVAYYAERGEGGPLNPSRSLWFTRSLRVRAGRATFDAVRTVLLLETLLADRSIEVSHLFMAPHLQRAVLDAASAAHRAQFRDVLRTPRGRRMDPHADHFHIRIRCPHGDRPACVER